MIFLAVHFVVSNREKLLFGQVILWKRTDGKAFASEVLVDCFIQQIIVFKEKNFHKNSLYITLKSNSTIKWTKNIHNFGNKYVILGLAF